MSRPDEADPFAASAADVRCWLGLFGAVVGFAIFIAVDPLIGAVVLATLLVNEPPRGVSLRPGFWRPGRWWPPIPVFVGYALVWVAFAALYLRACQWGGSPIEPQPALLELASGELHGSALWTRVLVIVVLAPFCEEVLFRGYLWSAVRTTMPVWATQLVVAVLFGLVHGLGHALPIGVLSLLFGYARARYGSLWPAMLAHAAHNGLTTLLVCTWPQLLDLFYNR